MKFKITYFGLLKSCEYILIFRYFVENYTNVLSAVENIFLPSIIDLLGITTVVLKNKVEMVFSQVVKTIFNRRILKRSQKKTFYICIREKKLQPLVSTRGIYSFTLNVYNIVLQLIVVVLLLIELLHSETT